MEANHNKTTSFYLCGGSIITRDRILTAAHCVEEFNNMSLKAKGEKIFYYITSPIALGRLGRSGGLSS